MILIHVGKKAPKEFLGRSINVIDKRDGGVDVIIIGNQTGIIARLPCGMVNKKA